MGQRFAVFAAFVLVLSVPFLVRTFASARGAAGEAADRSGSADAARLVIVTPHVEQIQEEFARAFDRWHARVHGRHARIDWRAPGGTSEIVKQLEATFEAAARKGQVQPDGSFPSGVAPFDLFFGGGSFEHGKMKEIKTVNLGGRQVMYRMGQPAGFTKAQLDGWFGENRIGSQTLYDPEQYWIGTALSGFGIVYNRDVLRERHLAEPESFADLTNFGYFNMLAMTDGRLSGSVTTTYDSILNKEGWVQGWKVLRELSGNARYFASAAPRPPIDVGQGEAAAGLAIDFYGRTQSQYLLRPGEAASEGRVGYVDPKGATYIDADPVSMLNGAGNRELALRFMEFCLTEEAQALWQFPAKTDPKSAANPPGEDGRAMGPDRYELRRMPVRRVMYEKYAAVMIDKVDPFTAATSVAARGWRSAIGPLMAAFGVDTAADCRAAWRALNEARAGAAAGRFSPGTLAEMERLFYSMPPHAMQMGTLLAPPEVLAGLSKPARDELSKLRITTFRALSEQLAATKTAGKIPAEIVGEWEKLLGSGAVAGAAGATPIVLELNEANFKIIKADTDSWRDPLHGKQSLIAYTTYFRDTYRHIVALYASGAEGAK